MHAGIDLSRPDDGGSVTFAKDVAVIKQGWRTLVATQNQMLLVFRQIVGRCEEGEGQVAANAAHDSYTSATKFRSVDIWQVLWYAATVRLNPSMLQL
jgi:hypothetical protein